jgi:hypothetical protein
LHDRQGRGPEHRAPQEGRRALPRRSLDGLLLGSDLLRIAKLERNLELFIHREIYEWGFLFEYAIAAYWIGDFEGALEANDIMLAMGKLPPAPEEDVIRNRELCVREIEKRRGVASR